MCQVGSYRTVVESSHKAPSTMTYLIRGHLYNKYVHKANSKMCFQYKTHNYAFYVIPFMYANTKVTLILNIKIRMSKLFELHYPKELL